MYYPMEAVVFGDRNIGQKGGSGKQVENEETIQYVKDLFQNGSSLSICSAPSRLRLHFTTVRPIWGKCLFHFPYELQKFQAMNECDKQKH